MKLLQTSYRPTVTSGESPSDITPQPDYNGAIRFDWMTKLFLIFLFPFPTQQKFLLTVLWSTQTNQRSFIKYTTVYNGAFWQNITVDKLKHLVLSGAPPSLLDSSWSHPEVIVNTTETHAASQNPQTESTLQKTHAHTQPHRHWRHHPHITTSAQGDVRRLFNGLLGKQWTQLEDVCTTDT